MTFNPTANPNRCGSGHCGSHRRERSSRRDSAVTSLEGEAGTLAGAAVVSLASAPSSHYSSPAVEASGHSYVQLTGTGQSVRWTNDTGAPVSAVNLREGIPDAPGGGGTTATLDLYVDGQFRQALNLNSKQSWFYENSGNYNGSSQNPADGNQSPAGLRRVADLRYRRAGRARQPAGDGHDSGHRRGRHGQAPVHRGDIKPGAVVVDAGSNPGPIGDVDFDGAMARASLLTPVPGGVGPMTIAVLLEQTIDAAERQTAWSTRSANPVLKPSPSSIHRG